MKLSQVQNAAPEILPPLDDPSSGDRAATRPCKLSAIAAAAVVHDLGNLIQIASSAINIIARTPDTPAIHAGLLGRARACLEDAGALVRQNLAGIRDQVVARERSNVAACLSDIAALVEAMDVPGLFLGIGLEPDLPEAQCDPVGLRRAVLNLVLNARDAMAGNGLVLIRARRISDSAVEVRVTDHGTGMSPDMIARAFDPFFTTKSDGMGGIGLPMVERFVRDAGGDVTIASEPGIGTTVTLRLPAITPAETLSEESDS